MKAQTKAKITKEINSKVGEIVTDIVDKYWEQAWLEAPPEEREYTPALGRKFKSHIERVLIKAALEKTKLD